MTTKPKDRAVAPRPTPPAKAKPRAAKGKSKADPGALPRKARSTVSPAVAAAVARAEARSAGKTPPKEATPPVPIDPVITTAEEIRDKLAAAKKRKPPVPYSDAIVERLCDHIAEGSSLRSFCELDDTPAYKTVLRWLADDGKADLRLRYARAREAQADAHADEMIDIARKEKDVNRARLIIDTMKWTASKLRPKKYGDKITSEVSGPDGGPIPVESRSDIENARRVAFALGRALERQKTAADSAPMAAGKKSGAAP